MNVPDHPPRRARAVASAAAAVSVVALAARLWSLPVARRIDFHIYAGAITSADGGSSLYDFSFRILGLGFTYPPFASIVLWPFAHLPTAVGEHVWLMLGLACSAWFLAVVGRELAPLVRDRWAGSALGDPVVAAAAVVAAGTWTMPVVLNARIGQVNAVLAALIAADVVLLRRGRAAAGVGTGIATAVKLVPGVLVPWMWFSGRRRAAVVAAATAAGATLLAWAVRPSDTVRYFTTELWATDRVGSLDNGFNNSLRRAVEWLPFGSGVRTLTWAALCAAVLVVGYRRAVRADRHGRLLTAVTLVMVAGYLVSPISWGHHLFFLVPAVALWCVGARRVWQWALAAVMVVALYDPFGVGEGPVTSAVRIGVLALLLVGLPCEDAACDHVPHAPSGPRSPSPSASPSPSR